VARARLASKLNRHADAEKAFTRLTELEPKNADAWRERARAGRLLESSDVCSASANAVFYNPSTPDNWLEHAQCFTARIAPTTHCLQRYARSGSHLLVRTIGRPITGSTAT
jgi:hypothetical protein